MSSELLAKISEDLERLADAAEAGVDLLQTRERELKATKVAILAVGKALVGAGGELGLPGPMGDALAEAIKTLESVP